MNELNMKYPKILIAAPTYSGKDYVLDEYVNHIRNIDYPNFQFILVDNSIGTSYLKKLRKKGINAFHTHRGYNSRSALAISYNFIRDYFLKGDFDYLLIVESDLLVPPDIIWKLLNNLISEQIHICAAPYFVGGHGDMPKVPCVIVFDKKNNGLTNYTRFVKPEEWNEMITNKGLHKIHGAGFGTCLMDRWLLENFKFRDVKELRKHADSYWYLDLHNAGVSVFLDTRIDPITHINQDWREIYEQFNE